MITNDQKTETFDTLLALALIFVAFGISLYGIGEYPIWNKDEGLYAESVREMFLNQNFFDPYFNYEHRWQKPILIYWVLSASSAIFGVNEFGIRFGLWALGAVSSLLLYFLAFRMFSRHNIALFATLFFVCSFAYILQTRHIATHMLLLFTVLLSFTVLWEIVKNGGSTLKSLLFGASLGLAFLAKGPVGVVIVLFVGAVFCAKGIIKAPKLFLKRFAFGAAAFMAVALPWYLYMLYLYGSEYIEFLNHEIFHRVGTNITGSNSPFFYVGAFAGNFAPWSLLFYASLILFVVSAIRSFKDSLTKELLFLLVIFFTVMVLFSLSASKLPAYVFMAQPFAALFLAYFVVKNSENRILKWLIFLTKIIFVVGLVALCALYFGWAWVVFGALVALFALFAFRRRLLLSKVALLALAAFFVIVANIFDEVSELFPYKNIGQTVERIAHQKGYEFYQYDMFRESLPFYAKQKLHRFDPSTPPATPFLIVLDREQSGIFTKDEYLSREILSSRYYKRSDSDVFRMINILKGYQNEEGRIGELVLLEVMPLGAIDSGMPKEEL